MLVFRIAANNYFPVAGIFSSVHMANEFLESHRSCGVIKTFGNAGGRLSHDQTIIVCEFDGVKPDEVTKAVDVRFSDDTSGSMVVRADVPLFNIVGR